MANWYQGNIRYQQQDEKGRLKTINEVYLVDAVSYTEAEARIYDIAADVASEFQISKLAKMRLNEVYFIENGGEIWFKIKIHFLVFDEKAGKDKKVPAIMLINAQNPREAYDALKDKLGKVEDYVITDINTTPILEVVPYEQEENPLKNGNFKPLSEVIDRETLQN
jgi:hypothetical protein